MPPPMKVNSLARLPAARSLLMDMPAMPVPNPTRTNERENIRIGKPSVQRSGRKRCQDDHQSDTGRDLQYSLLRIHGVAPPLLAPV